MDTKEVYDDVDADYIADEKKGQPCSPPRYESGKVFGLSNLSDPENSDHSPSYPAALKAYGIMHRDEDYVVKDNEVIIVDTGRHAGQTLFGRPAPGDRGKGRRQNQKKPRLPPSPSNYFRINEKLSV